MAQSKPASRSSRQGVTEVTHALRSGREALIFAALFTGVINILMLTGPLFMIQVYDRVLTSRSIPTLIALAAVAIGLYIFVGLLEFIRTRMMIRLGAMFDERLRMPVFDRMIEHAVRKTPNVGTQPLRDLEAVRQFMSGPAPFALFDLPWLPIYVLVNYLLHPVLGYVTLFAALLLFCVAALAEWSGRTGSTAVAKAMVASHSLAEEAHSSAEVLRAMGIQKNYATRWSGVVDTVVQNQWDSSDRSSVYSSITKVIRLVLQSVALGLGAYLAVKGEISAGVIIAGSTVMSRALAPVDQAIAHWRGYTAYRKSMDRLRDVLQPLSSDASRMELPEPKGAIATEGLMITAPQSNNPVAQGITFNIAPGGGMAIIGPSGSGKSSLARALVGAWPAAKGTIRLDGANLEQWPPDQLGRAIGYLPQDVSLLSGTIQDNISRFVPNPDPKAVVQAARQAGVHEMILRFADGYNTRLGLDGVQLSGGQRQRIALARAFYGGPALLVLDEPNSNLDTDGESALTVAIKEARQRGTTVIVVAHRPSAIRFLDHLLFLKEGRQVAFGPKDEVLAKINSEAAGQRPPNIAVVREQA
jgi:PrtD family type I secretion system ABC transporter